MIAEFSRALGRAVTRLSTVIGIITTAIGFASDLSGIKFVLPSWVWWLIAICATLFTAARIQMELDSQKAGKKVPSVTLAQLVERIVGSNDLHAAGVPTKIGNALKEIRQKALLGGLSTWGQKGGNRNDDYDPLERIPSEHWTNAHIDYLQYLKDKRCATTNARHPGSPEQYSNIHFDVSEVDEMWPVSRQKLRFRLPFVWG